jgi:X-X-X-Leu-X-X-Gly heptad repeat protein
MLFAATNSVVAEESDTSKYSSTDPAEIENKEEVIYANLSDRGQVEEIYAVNIINVMEEGIITDYGNYSALKNLTNTETINYENGKVSAYAKEGRFYYQGTVEQGKLPWEIAISYYLNQEKVSGKDLAGKEGKVEIEIHTSPSKEFATYFENYILQVSVTLDSEHCNNIVADKAIIANAGSDKLITFTIMPGSEGNVKISMDTTDFEMDSITLSAVPFAMDVALPDTTSIQSDLTSLSDAIAQLNNGVSELKGGATNLSTGAERLKKGSTDFEYGFDKLNRNSGKLIKASASILEALNYINSNLKGGATSSSDLSSLAQLPAGLGQMVEGLNRISSGMEELSQGYTEANKALSGAIETIPERSITENDLQELLKVNPNNSALAELIKNYKAAQTVKGTYDYVSPAFKAVETNLPAMKSSVDTISISLQSIVEQITSNLSSMDINSTLTELSEGLGTLASNYSEFHKGLEGYTEGVEKLNGAYNQINNGVDQLTEGTGELSEGIKELSEGTDKLHKETKDIPNQMEGTMEDLLENYDKSAFVPTSVLSNENNQVASVQFIIKTESIKNEVQKETETLEKEKDNFWIKLKKLFV